MIPSLDEAFKACLNGDMFLFSAKLVALMSLAAARLTRIRVPVWFFQFSLWRLRQDFPTALREVPALPFWGPPFFDWIFHHVSVAMAMMAGRVRYEPYGGGAIALGSLDARRNLNDLRAAGYAQAIEDVRPLVAPFAAWIAPYGKEAAMPVRAPADAYADILIALFSLAAVNHGHVATRVADFHRLMVALRKEFPDEMPPFDEVGRPPFQSSELLSDALHRALCADPPRLTIDTRGNLTVDVMTAMRNLNAFDPFSRQRCVKRFTAMAERFVALQREHGPPVA